jgi:hypothetical protein
VGKGGKGRERCGKRREREQEPKLGKGKGEEELKKEGKRNLRKERGT